MGHLLSLGHVRIGLVLGPPDHVPSKRKLAAARAFALRAEIPLDAEQIVHAMYSMETAQAAAVRLLRTGVTAVVCASDPMALGTIRAARRAGLRVPEDLSVVGFDDSSLMNYTDPPLTTVRQPIEPMGRIVTELLIAQISGASVPHDELLLEPELVVRASTAPAPAAA
jgi:DNA-binding LacI/PurR family transcriptional regulator